MADTILIKRNFASGSIPSTSSLEVGELAINVADGKLFLKQSGSNVDVVRSLLTLDTPMSGNVLLSGSIILPTEYSISTPSITGSLFGTASWAQYAITASYVSGAASDWESIANKPIGLVSSSEQLNTGSFSGSFTGKLIGTSSWSTNSISASIAANSIVTASAVNTTITFIKGDGAQFTVTLAQSGSVESASYAILAATASYIQFANIDNIPALLSSSTQVNYTQLQNVPSGIVSSSTQVDYINIQNKPTTIPTASYVEYVNVVNKPTLLSSSTQVNYTQLSNIPAGILSSSTQFNSLTNTTASFATTASAATSITFTPATSSFAISASFAPTKAGVISSSLQINTGSFSGSFNGVFIGTSSWAQNSISSSFTVTSSFAQSASFAPTILPTGIVSSSTQINTGSFSGSFVGTLTGTGSWANNSISASFATTASFARSASFAPTILPSGIVSSSTQINTGSFSGSFTGNFIGTSSWANNAVSASRAISASFAPTILPSGIVSSSTQINTGSFSGSFTGILIGTSSWSNNSVSASFAPTNAGVVSSSTQINYTQLQNIPVGIVSSSTQVQTVLPIGTVSSSVQINTGSFSGSITSASFATTASFAQNYILPLGVISSSAQVTQSISGSIIQPSLITGSTRIIGKSVSVNNFLELYPTTDVISPDPDSAYFYISGSSNDLWYSHKQDSTVNFDWIEGVLETGLLYGGVISFSGSTVYVSEGSGIIITHGATTSSAPQPTVNYLKWTDITQSVDVTSRPITYLYIDANGSLQQQGTKFTSFQYHESIPLGAVGHFNNTSIVSAGGQINSQYTPLAQLTDFTRNFGPIKVAGYGLSGQSGSLRISIGEGSAFIYGGFYKQNPETPSNYTSSPTATGSMGRVYRSGSTESGYTIDSNNNNFYTVLDPTKYDDGSGILANVSASQYTIQRAFIEPVSKICYIYYGQSTYDSLTTAVSNILSDTFTEGPATTLFTVFAGYIVVKGNATDLADTTQCRFISAGLFRNTSAGSTGGGTSTTTLLSLSDVDYTTPSTGDALIYNAGVWTNGYPLSASYAPTILPVGTVSSSTQINYTQLQNIPIGIVSSSTQINTGSFSGSFTGTLIGTSSWAPSASVAVSASFAPSNNGVVSSSSQINYTQLQNIPNGIVSSSTQVTILLPAGVVSSSLQINTGSFSGSFTGPHTGSTLGTASNAISSSFAITASAATSITFIPTTASFASTASFVNILNQNVSSSGNIEAGTNLRSNYSVGDEGGEINLARPQTNTSISGSVIIDVNGNRVRIFEANSPNRGGYWDITSLASGVGTNLAGGAGTVTSITAGNGLTGGTITGAGTIAVDTGSAHFITGSINVLNLRNVVSSSTQINTGSFSGSFTGTLIGTSSWASNAVSSSAATSITFIPASASYANNADLLDGLNSTVLATTGSNSFVGNQTITGSITSSGTGHGILLTSGTVSYSTSLLVGTGYITNVTNGFHRFRVNNSATGFYFDGGLLAPELNGGVTLGNNTTRWGNVFTTGSINHTGSFNILSGSINVVNGGITSSLLGTSSWASNAVSTSFATTASAATSITFIPNTASFATTASFALNAGAGSGFPYNGIITPAVISGSLIISGSATQGLFVTGSTTVLGAFQATTKSFKIDHQRLIGKKLIYGVLEGPEHGVYVRGRVNGGLTGTANIQLPDEWEWLVDANSITVQLTPIGNMHSVYVRSVENNTVALAGNDMFDCFYFIQATRKDVPMLDTVE